MKNKNFIKAIGIAVTVIGFGVSILTDWVNEKKMDEKIEESLQKRGIRSAMMQFPEDTSKAILKK